MTWAKSPSAWLRGAVRSFTWRACCCYSPHRSGRNTHQMKHPATANKTPSLGSVQSTHSRPLPRTHWRGHRSRDGRRSILAASPLSFRGIAPPGFRVLPARGSRDASGFSFVSHSLASNLVVVHFPVFVILKDPEPIAAGKGLRPHLRCGVLGVWVFRCSLLFS